MAASSKCESRFMQNYTINLCTNSIVDTIFAHVLCKDSV